MARMSEARLTRKLESVATAVGIQPGEVVQRVTSGDPRAAFIELQRLEDARRNAILSLLDSANPDDRERNRQLFDAKVNLGHVRRSVMERARMSTPIG